MEAAEPSANIERHNVSWDPFVSGIPFFFFNLRYIYIQLNPSTAARSWTISSTTAVTVEVVGGEKGSGGCGAFL